MEKTNLLYYNQIMKEYKETQHTLMYKSTSDLSFYSAGYEECSPGYSYGPRFRSYQLIHFVLSGKGELHINEHVFQLMHLSYRLERSPTMRHRKRLPGVMPGLVFWELIHKDISIS